jgi:hypothetical protein
MLPISWIAPFAIDSGMLKLDPGAQGNQQMLSESSLKTGC